MTDLNISLVQYRNAVYHGGFNKGRREGKGILVTDSGEVFVGTWKNDNLNDKALIWLNQKTYVIGDFNRGLMDGQFVYRDNKSLFFAQFSNNKLTGKLIYIEELGKQRKVKCYEYKNLNYREVFERSFHKGDQKLIFKELLGYEDVELPELKDFIKNEMLRDGTYTEAIMPMGHTYIGFNKGDTVERVGFTYSKDDLVSYGVYIDKKLDGIGFKFENGTKFEGMFKNGVLNGFGLRYQIQQNKYAFGFYEKGVLKELNDIGNAEEESVPNMINIKKKMHIQSVHFFNSFVKVSSMLKYRGYEQIIYRSNRSQKQYMFPDTGNMGSRSVLKSNEEYPIIRKIQSGIRENDDGRDYIKVGPSKMGQSTQRLAALASRKIIEKQPEINPQRELRGSNAILTKMERVQSSKGKNQAEYGYSSRQRPYK